MSYILDALRRADAERDRQTASSVLFDDSRQWSPRYAPPSTQRNAPWMLLITLALMALIGGWTIWHFWPSAISTTTSVPSSPTPAAQPATVVQMPPPTPVEVASRSTAPLPVQPAIPTPIAVADVAPIPAPVKPPAPVEKPLKMPASVNTASTTSPAAKVSTLDELPPDLRSRVPALQVGGSVYSEDIQTRMVILNGQLLHENESLQPGLVLRKIQPKFLILELDGHRFRINI